MKDHSFPGPDTIHRHVLDNGIVILAYENFAVPSFEIEGYVPAGNLGEFPPRRGLAAFTAANLMRGTANRTFESIYEELESVGAELGFSGGRHTTGFSGGGLDEDFDLVLDVLADALRHPSFPPEHAEKVRGEILTSLQIQANDTRSQANKAFRALLYGDHPYGAHLQGTPESVAGLSAADLTDFHGSYYGPRGMVITVVGAIKAEAAVARIKSALGDWRNPAQKSLPAVAGVARPTELLRTHVVMPEKSQSDVVLGLPGPLRTTPDYQDLRLANTILGIFGMYGRLGKRVREEQGLAYYVYSSLQGGLGPAPWTCATGVAPGNVDQAVASIRAEIRRMQEERVPAEELADSQAYLTGSLPVSLETNSGLASVLTDMELYQLGMDYLRHYVDLVNGVTAEKVQLAAQTHWSADEIAVAVAGP